MKPADDFVEMANKEIRGKLTLTDEYIKENVVRLTSRDDCIHIAAATINNIDILVSWNFKHIVNVRRIRGYNTINMKNGYKQLEIRSPKEVVSYELG